MSSLRQIVGRLVAAGAALAMSTTLLGSGPPADAAPAKVPAASKDYRVTLLTSRSGAVFQPSYIYGSNPINKQGQVAGFVQQGGLSRAAVFDTKTSRIKVFDAYPGFSTLAVDINDHGDVVGHRWTQGQSGSARVFWASTKSKKINLLPLRGADYADATAINNRGRVLVKRYYATDVFRRGKSVLWGPQTGSERSLGNVIGQALNNKNWVAGKIVDTDPEWTNAATPVIWRPNAKLIKLPLLENDDQPNIFGLNDRGQAVGESMNHEVEDELFGEPVLWTAKTRSICRLTSIGVLAQPMAIDNHGRVVGDFDDITTEPENRLYRAVTWSGCSKAPVVLPGEGNQANGINDSGRMVGLGGSGSQPYAPYGVRWDR